MDEKTKEDARQFATAVARSKGWKVNTESDLVEPVIQGLCENFNRFGYFQCPCRDSWGEREKDKDIICPCTYAQADIDEYGQCFCGLFVTPQFITGGMEATGIPERRPEDLYP